MSDYTMAVYEATIADLRAQLAERDAQLTLVNNQLAAVRPIVIACEVAATHKTNDTTNWYMAFHAVQCVCRQAWEKYQATRQPTQDKGQV